MMIKIILCSLLLSLSIQGQSKSVDSVLYKNLSKVMKLKSEKDIVEAASKILAIDENNFKAINALAIFYYEAKKYNMAKLLLERGLKADPGNKELKNNMALVHFAQGDRRKGLVALKDAAQGGKVDGESNLNLSSIYVEHRDYEKALGPLSKIYSKIKPKLKTKSRAAVALANNYAVSLVGAKDYSAAEKVFKTAQEAGVRDTNLLYNYAVFMVQQGKNKEDAYKVISRLKFLTEDQKLLRKVELLEKTLDNKK